jgi:hypothetical protein
MLNVSENLNIILPPSPKTLIRSLSFKSPLDNPVLVCMTLLPHAVIKRYGPTSYLEILSDVVLGLKK